MFRQLSLAGRCSQTPVVFCLLLTVVGFLFSLLVCFEWSNSELLQEKPNKQKLLDRHAVPPARLPPAATSVPRSARATAWLVMLSCASSLFSVPFVLLRWLKHHLKASQCSHFYPKQEANLCFCFSLCHLEASEQLGQLCSQLWK